MHAKRSDRDSNAKLPTGDVEDEDEDDTDVSDDDAVDYDDSDDDENVTDMTGELKVEELMAQLERTEADDIARKKAIRRRLEEIEELRGLEDTYSFDLYKDD